MAEGEKEKITPISSASPGIWSLGFILYWILFILITLLLHCSDSQLSCVMVVIAINILQTSRNYHPHHHTHGRLYFTKVVSVDSPSPHTLLTRWLWLFFLWDAGWVCNYGRSIAIWHSRRSHKSQYSFCLVLLGHHVQGSSLRLRRSTWNVDEPLV